MESLIKAKFSHRFIESGRVLSTLDMKKQRVLGRIENVAYIALYNPLEDKWALVRNSDASYPCFSLDNKGNPIVIYVDRVGNIRERVIKQEMFDKVLETSEGSLEFRDTIKATQNVLKDNYTLSFIKPSLGYDLSELPYSCQKGKGHFFKWLDDIAKMALLKNNVGKIVARCLVWDKENIAHNGENLQNDIADRLYYSEGIHRIALRNALKKQGIDCIWEKSGDRPFHYAEYILSLPEAVQDELNEAISYSRAPFMDTFNHYNSDRGVLYSFHWVDRLNHSDCEWDGSVDNVLLCTNGTVITEDEEIWDNYNGEYINPDDAVEPLNYDGYVHRDSCIYSEYHDGYLVEDDIICVRTPGGYDDYDYTYHGSGVELIEINDEVYFLDNVRRYRA